LAVALAGLAAAADTPPASAALQSYQRARQVLDRALEAAGGSAAVLGTKDVSRKGTAVAYNQGQSLRPMDPYTTRGVEVMNALDFAQARSVAESVTTPAGGLSTKTRTVLKADTGFTHNALTNVVTPATAAAVTNTR